MEQWNVLVTSASRQSDRVADLLRAYGQFALSGYRDVLLGRVDRVDEFLKNLKDLLAQNREADGIVCRVILFEKVFRFDTPDQEHAEKEHGKNNDTGRIRRFVAKADRKRVRQTAGISWAGISIQIG